MRVLSLFDGISCARVALEKCGIPVETYYASEIDKYAIEISSKNYPDIIHVGDVTKLKGEDFKDIDLLIGGSPCFVSGTLITTINGQKPIEDIIIGDTVLTHNGLWKKVTKTYISENYTRKIKGYGFLEIETTDEHPFLVKNRTNVYIDHKHGYKRVLSDNYMWDSSKNLKPFKSYVTSVTPTNLVNFNNHPNAETINTEDFWWVVGRFIGDGWLRDRKRNGKKQLNYSVIICCGKHESNELEPMLNKVFGKVTKVEERTTFKYTITRKWFAEFVSIVGRGAKNKEIPPSWFTIDSKYRKALLDGYMSADGCVRKKGRETGFGTISKKLCVSTMMLAHSLGIPMTQYMYERGTTWIIENRTCNTQNETYSGYYLVGKNRSQTFLDGKYLWKPVKKNESTNEIKTVYNIEVEDDNSYVANGIVVHNCTDLSIAKKDRQGLRGNHSSLFWEYVRLLDEIKPKYFVLENVESMPKDDFDIITKTLKVTPIMINAALLSAQNRKRYFWTNIDVYNLPEDKGIMLKDILQKEVDKKYIISDKHVLAMKNTRKNKQLNLPEQDGKCGTITASYYKTPQDAPYIKQIGELVSENKTSDFSQGYRVYSDDGKAVTLSANGGGLGSKTGLYCISSEEEHEESLIAPNGKAIKIDENIDLQVLKEVRSEIGKKERSELRKIMGKDTTPRSKDSKEYIGVNGEKANCLTTSPSAENFIVQKNDVELYHVPHGYKEEKITNEEKYPTLHAQDPRTNHLIILDDEETDVYATQLGNSELFGNSISDTGKAFTLRASEPNGVIINTVVDNKQKYREGKSREYSEKCPTLSSRDYKDPLQVHNKFIVRKLTPVECERLQGLPDDYTAMGTTASISDTQRYKCLGNAFNADVVAYILNHINNPEPPNFLDLL